jgi:hypothetical protein
LEPPASTTDHPGRASAPPQLARLLDRLGRRLDALILAHGLGTLLAAVSIWLAFAFVADWWLHVPRAVRMLHLAVLLALPIGLAIRMLVLPLRRRPRRDGLALLIERSQPELKELLVSAVQFSERGAGPDSDPRLVASLVAQAEQRAAQVSLEGVLAPAQPRLRLATGGLLAAGLLAAVAWQPDYAVIFFDRLAGGTLAWPQRTHLYVSIPLASGEADDADGRRLRVAESEGHIEVVVARGNDVPVLVRAEGALPEEVTLEFEDGARLAISSSGDGQFRTLLRSCQEDAAFRAVGGDDLDGEPRVSIRVLDPPDVTGVAVRIEPPAYSGLAAELTFDRDVEVLRGSRLSIVARPDPADARGQVRLLPEDRVLALEERPFPAENPEDTPAPGLGFDLAVEDSLRYRFELSDATGLENPDPGLFAVRVVTDRRPEVELFSPARGEVDVVAGGALRIVAQARDDYGLERLSWRAGLAASEEVWGPDQQLADQPALIPAGEQQQGAVRLGSARVEITDLPPLAGREPTTAPVEGDVYVLEASARDNRPPPPPSAEEDEGLGRSAVVRVRVVAGEEYLRKLQDRLGRLRAQATEVEALQREKAARVRELIAALESDDPDAGARSSEVAAALAGQRRVLGDVGALERELASVLEGVLYARLDAEAGDLLESLDHALAQSHSKAFDPAPWRALVERDSAPGEASRGLARQLMALLALALAAGEEDAPAASAALDTAARSIGLEEIHANLLAAAAAQERLLGRLDELIARLSEWESFQSVLNLARDILSRQKSVRDRTKQALEGR